MSQRRVIVGVQQGVFDEAGLAREDRARRHAAARQRHGLAPLPGEGRILIVATEGSQLQHAPVQAEQQGPVGLAQVARQRHDAVEHGLHVGRRAADHLQHLGSGRLLPQGLLGVVEQPHVLDRDDRLVREGLQQLDLLRAEVTRLGPRDGDLAEHRAIAQQRHRGHGPEAARQGNLPIGGCRARVGQHVGKLDGLTGDLRVERIGLAQVDPGGPALQRLAVLSTHVGERHHPRALPVPAPDRRRVPVQQPAGAAGNRVQHRLNIVRRLGDDLEDLGGGGLALQRVLGLVEQPHVLDADHRLVGEGLRQRDVLGIEGLGMISLEDQHAEPDAVRSAQQRQHQRGAHARAAPHLLLMRRELDRRPVRDVQRRTGQQGPRREVVRRVQRHLSEMAGQHALRCGRSRGHKATALQAQKRRAVAAEQTAGCGDDDFLDRHHIAR
mmetsp:Transcript_70472/g.166163  ORF Transcript_70472/g.166163 Transcript_70472/m.166163 type:complete len:439 (-) Transcript_70472:517-1833(-)